MNLKDYIFCALDFSDLNQTIEFTDIIKNDIGGIKLGLEFFANNGPAGVEKLKKFKLPIFLDLKLHDIPNTVTNTVKNILKLQPDYLTIHLSGGRKMLEEVNKIKKNTKIIGVSMLTSLDKKDLEEIGLELTEKEYVKNLVALGIDAGVDGVVTSPSEAELLRKEFSKKLILVTPGIRLPNTDLNDQKRSQSPGLAIKSGSSMLVIGRPITKSAKPVKIIKLIMKDIEEKIGS